MANYQIYYVGTDAEVAHHAAPLQREIDVRIIKPSEVARHAGPNDLAIFFSEHFHRFRDAWLQLSRKGCNTLYAIDGILEWRNAWENRDDEPACPWTMRPVLSDKVACIGASQARVLNAWGNLGKTEITGIPRMGSIVESASSGPVNVSRDENGNDKFRVLATTAKWPGFTPQQIQATTQSLQDLKQFFEANPIINGREVQPVWRLTGDLDQVIGVDNQLDDISGKELAEVLQTVDAVITSPSTVMLEVMLSGLPVCLLDYTNSPRYVDAAWSITAKSQFAEVLTQIASPSSRRMFLQRSILEDSLQCNERATQRLIQLVNEMIRIGHDCRAANRPVVFPANILPAPSIKTVLDSPTAIPALQSTFSKVRSRVNSGSKAGANSDECIMVAAESLRRVNHLNARIELLESELAKAEQGFSKIASHPILAPLVKVRQFAGDMGNRIQQLLSMASSGPSDETETETETEIETETKTGITNETSEANSPAATQNMQVKT